jgi:hypothetical protein
MTPTNPNIPDRQQWTPFPDPHTPFQNYVPLVWRGKRVEDLPAMSQEASDVEQSGDMELAERKYREALSAYEHMLSPTHKDTLHLGYQVAGFYAKQNKMLQADEVLDWMGRMIVGQWGLSHRNSNAHYMRVSNLYRTWSREEDASKLIRRLSEGLIRQRNATASSAAHQDPYLQSIQKLLTESRNISPNETISDEANIDQQLKCIEAQLVDTPSIISVSEIKVSLLDLIERCKEGLPKLGLQLLKAASVLVQLTEAMSGSEAESMQRNATELCLMALKRMEKTTEKKITEKNLKAALEVAHHLIEVGAAPAEKSAERLLELVSAQAEQNFQFESKENIMILIGIACLYGDGDWQKGKLWVEHALSASMSLCRIDDPLLECLQAALEAESVPSFDVWRRVALNQGVQ